MEPLLIVLGLGLVGGMIMALLMRRVHRETDLDPTRVVRRGRLEPLSPDLINMARIRVDGVGGLGMVAMAVAVALAVPRIRLTMFMAALLGGALAAVLIAVRRRSDPLSSGRGNPGAHAMLPLDRPAPRRAPPSTPPPVGPAERRYA